MKKIINIVLFLGLMTSVCVVNGADHTNFQTLDHATRRTGAPEPSQQPILSISWNEIAATTNAANSITFKPWKLVSDALRFSEEEAESAWKNCNNSDLVKISHLENASRNYSCWGNAAMNKPERIGPDDASFYTNPDTHSDPVKNLFKYSAIIRAKVIEIKRVLTNK